MRRCSHIEGLHLITWDDRFQPIAGKLANEWLRRFPNVGDKIQRYFWEAAILFGDRAELVELIQERLPQIIHSDSPEERGVRDLTIGAAFLLDFEHHREIISHYASEAADRIWAFRDACSPDLLRRRSASTLPWPHVGSAEYGFLLETFAPRFPIVPHPDGWSGNTNAWDASDFLEACARNLSLRNDEYVGVTFRRLLENNELSPYHEKLRHLYAAWKRRIREESLDAPSANGVLSILSNTNPATVSDLQAMMIESIEWLQDDIRNGDTKGWLRFWEGEKPISENDARDHILDRIRHRFEPLSVQLRPECLMPEDKRADIVASMNHSGTISDLPVEVKGQWNEGVWSAAVEQLDARYTRYVHARNRGVYLVLWFGNVSNKRIRKRLDGLAVPKTARDLAQQLRADLPSGLRGRIDVAVLDVSRP
jgi:hypothetical protein